MEPAKRIDECHARLEEGFDTLKMRVHDFDERIDIRDTQEPAAAMAGRMKLAVDCNQAFWQTANGPGPKWDVARAKRFCDAAHDAGLAWVEEPLFMEWHDAIAEVTGYSRVPVSGGRLRTPAAEQAASGRVEADRRQAGRQAGAGTFQAGFLESPQGQEAPPAVPGPVGDPFGQIGRAHV